MNILAINTAFSESYVAVLSGDKSYLKSMDSSLKQSENILGLIDTCLDEVGARIEDLDGIACVIGPGSFTGIRIGASLAKGFCISRPNIKRVPINSLDLLAFTFAKKASGNFWVLLNALSGYYFACEYDGSGNKIREPFLADGEDIDKICGVVVGLEEEGLEPCNTFVSFTAEDLLKFSVLQYENAGNGQDFTPLYLRKSQAEAELDKKKKE